MTMAKTYDFSGLFSEDKPSITLDELNAGIKGAKLVDLSGGEYVAKEKFDAEVTKREATATELDKLKAAGTGDDALKAQITALEREKADAVARAERAEGDLEGAKGEVTKSQRADIVREKATHLSAKLQRLLREDAEKLVTDEFDFAAAVDKVIADDSDYAAPEGEGEKPAPARVSTGKPASGSAGQPDLMLESLEKGLGVKADE